jgi:hypothetical protein
MKKLLVRGAEEDVDFGEIVEAAEAETTAA